ncbi:hypothetical protein [Acinetobacter pittii]|uniref:hypothetical protein n=1 Tax=Acinetobacter TaxID=469 RepID=UPI0009C08DAD|nr:hypothetical protein [Acinetobacter pittii]
MRSALCCDSNYESWYIDIAIRMEGQRAGNDMGNSWIRKKSRPNDLFGPTDYRSNGPLNSPLG